MGRTDFGTLQGSLEAVHEYGRDSHHLSSRKAAMRLRMELSPLTPSGWGQSLILWMNYTSHLSLRV